ncbi:ubiquitin hydrolase [Trypanosoma theileri]|uniref:Ubiquitin hydrolase n=1 Tax=Trypanosoma theileri TaxID=67003 RepID=A0A1X0NSB8_9TRYP|nr:ubiquitin hydrolase [Trypanosoma theileri]ORC87373.1 ubiquitin hydrolase [Trypanosoma theileri]
MSQSFTNVNLGPIGDDAIVNNGETSREESPLSRDEEQNSQNGSLGSVSSHETSAGDGLDSSPHTTEIENYTHPEIKKTFTERYVGVVVSRLKKYIPPPGLSRSLGRYYSDVAVFKDGVATFEMPLLAEMRKPLIEILDDTEREMEMENEGQRTIPGEDTMIEIDVARKLFLGFLINMINGVVESLYSQPSYYWRKHLSEIQEPVKLVTERLVEDYNKNQKYYYQGGSSNSIKELNSILLHDFEVWVSSLFPYLNYVFSSQRQTNLVWCMNTSVDKEEMAFRIYSIISRVNLVEKENGVAKGVLFPVNWLRILLQWLSGNDTVDSSAVDGPIEAAPSIPGPFNSYRLLELSRGESFKFILREGDEAADVIPEELFDYFWSQFGGGPKYLVKGAFKMRQHMKECLKPKRFSIAIAFEGMKVESIVMDDVLRRAEVLEVARRALQKVKEQCSGSEGIQIAEWRAALCTGNDVDVFLTHLKGQGLRQPHLIPCGSAKTVGGILSEIDARLGMKINNSTPCSTSGSSGGGGISSSSSSSNSSSSKKKKNKEKEFISAVSPRRVVDLQLEFSLRQKPDRSILERCGVCGLMNVGNTCYMNSALQCLSNVRNMRLALFSLPLSDYANPSITKELVNLLLEMWSGSFSTVNTRELKCVFGREVRRFDTFEQQDAMEFIEVLLDRVHEELNVVCSKKYRERLDSDKSIPTLKLSTIFWEDFLRNNQSFIPKLFFHQSKTRLQCLTCGETSIVFDNNPTLAATVTTLPKKYVFPVIVLMPSGVRVQLWVKVPCNEDGFINVDAIQKEVTTMLNSQVESSVADAVTTTTPTTNANTTTTSDNAINSSNNDNDITTTATTSTTNNNGNNGNGNNTNNNNNNDSGTISGLHLPDGYRIIMYAISSKAIKPVHQTLYCAAVPIQPQPTQEYDSNMLLPQTRKEEENKNENVEQKEEESDEDSGRYLWFFIRPTFLTSSSQCKLCHVERLTATTSTTEVVLDPNYLIKRGRELAKRFLKRRSQNEMERLNKAVDPQRYPQEPQQQQQQEEEGAEEKEEQEEEEEEEQQEQQQQEELNNVISEDFYRYFSILYQSSKHHAEVSVDAMNDRDEHTRRRISALKTYHHTCESRVIISYDDRKLRENDTLRDVTQQPPNAAMHFTSRRSTGYYNDIEDTVTLDRCLRSTFSPDTLAGDDARYCSKCKMLRDSRVERSLFLLPPCLIVSLKRFKVRLQEASKNNAPVEVSKVLDVAPFLDVDSPERNTKYTLRGVVFHSGSISFGHYTASALNDSVNKWIYYDDTYVSLPPSDHSIRDAYIMFYERVESGTNESQRPMSETSRL